MKKGPLFSDRNIMFECSQDTFIIVVPLPIESAPLPLVRYRLSVEGRESDTEDEMDIEWLDPFVLGAKCQFILYAGEIQFLPLWVKYTKRDVPGGNFRG